MNAAMAERDPDTAGRYSTVPSGISVPVLMPAVRIQETSEQNRWSAPTSTKPLSQAAGASLGVTLLLAVDGELVPTDLMATTVNV